MTSDTFKQVRSTVLYIEDRGPDTTTVVGALIVGTAFVFDPDEGILVTAAHVIEGLTLSSLRIRASYGRDGEYAFGSTGFPANAIATILHPEYDLAAIRINPIGCGSFAATWNGAISVT